MTVVIATGNAILDAHIKRFFESSRKVSYLEELSNVKKGEAQVVLLSAFLPSVRDDVRAALRQTIDYLLKEEVRVVYLTDNTTPLEELYRLFEMGVYDFVISKDGNVSLDEIINKANNPTSKEEAKRQLDSLVKGEVSKIKEREQEQETVLYHELEIKPKQIYEEVTERSKETQELEIYHQLDYKEKDVVPAKEVKQVLEEKELIHEFTTSKPVRKKTTAKVGTNTEEPKIFSFWSPSSNLGKRTISQAYAAQIAKLGYSVLYVEFDYLNPALALTTALSHPSKNFYQLALSQDSFDLRQYIATKMDVKITKDMVDLFEEIPHELHFLGLPSGFVPDSFPSITNEDFLNTLLSALKEIEYDAVVINLPTEIDNLFSFPVMLESDVVFSVVSSNPVRISEYRSYMKMLVETPLKMDKWKVIVNQVGRGITKEHCDQMLREKSIITVPYDMERPAYELDLRIGSPIINQKMIELAGMFGFMAPETNTKKKGLFGLLR
jgi:hypothetical protein